jgi:tetratricopeptide (TPR) repeat protein
MRSMIKKIVSILVTLFIFGISGYAQDAGTAANSTANLFKEGVGLFNEGNYGSAIYLFEQVRTREDVLLSDASVYFIAASRLELGNTSGEADLKQFVDKQPGSPYVNAALFRLADLTFNRKNYKETLQLYGKMETSSLTRAERDKYTFNTGVSLLETGDKVRAKSNFNQLRNSKGAIGDGSKYYWAHISYLDGAYDEALSELKKLENTPVYFKLIPYYQIQVDFARGKYGEVVKQGVPLLARAPEERKFEVARVLIISDYQLEEYDAATDLIDKYFKSKEVSRADCYVAGFCQEKSGRTDEAIRWYEKSIQQNDAISQGAYYQLGGLYMKKGEKKKGLIAFQHASEMKFDPKIRKDALFQYAKATYELDYSPFNESIRALDKYIAEYPDAKENDEAYKYLVNVFMTTHNYKDALASMDRIKVKSPSVKKAYQRVSLYRGLELFRDLNFEGALRLFDKSLENGSFNPDFKARAQYWRAETLYRLGRTDAAFAEYKKFQSLPGSTRMDEYATSFYNMGYHYFNRQDLSQAAFYFGKFKEYASGKNDNLVGDVYNRLGDCSYANRNYDAALANYQNAIDVNAADADYSHFQKAFTHGLMQDQPAKIEDLKTLLSKYPESPYCDDAIFETGKAREKMNDLEGAKASYKDLIARYPGSILIPKALAQLGLIAYNQNQYDVSIAYYKEVIDRYPDTQEARGALTGIKNNYLENNQVDEYISYTRKLGNGATPSQNEQDSLTYSTAEKQYMAHASNASDQLSKYLTTFPEGNFTVNAHFYRAEIAYNDARMEEALRDYEAVLSEPDNLFTESALNKAAGLSFDAKEYTRALDYFNRIEKLSGAPANMLAASVGIMRCQYELGNWDEVVKVGWKIRSSGKIAPELDRESSYKSAKAYEALKDEAKALPLWRKLSSDPKSKEGAEAKYNVCKYYSDNNRLKDAENEVMDFIGKNSPQKYWLGKSFILLAHIYEKMNDLFQATNTLKSVIENYEVKDDGIVEAASAYLKLLEQKK